MFDCWGLLWFIYLNYFGVELELHPVDPIHHEEVAKRINAGVDDGQWVRLMKPVDGCAVALSKSKVFHHVGIFTSIDGGLVLHAHDSGRVVAQSLAGLRSQGWSRIQFYKHKSL